MFPFEIHGSVRIRNLPDARALREVAAERIASKLAALGAKTSTVDGTLRFTADTDDEGSILLAIDSGTVRIEAGDHTLLVSYSLSTRDMAGTLAIGMLFLDILVYWRHPLDAGVIWLPVIGWLVLYGGNYMITKTQLHFWMKGLLKTIG